MQRSRSEGELSVGISTGDFGLYTLLDGGAHQMGTGERQAGRAGVQTRGGRLVRRLCRQTQVSLVCECRKQATLFLLQREVFTVIAWFKNPLHKSEQLSDPTSRKPRSPDMAPPGAVGAFTAEGSERLAPPRQGLKPSIRG